MAADTSSFPAACRVSVAPMMQRTDRHCRYFHRLLAPGIGLYTEMVHAQAVIHSNDGRFLKHHPAERPLALQLGGSEPETLAEATALATQADFDEINLNVGCPSSRVKAGRFGACLMHEPERVADCVRAMRGRAAGRPVTVKTRIGTNHRQEFSHLLAFARAMQEAGVAALIVHARIAVLEGLSPKENRNVPPLRYEFVYRLKQAMPDLPVVINGGVCASSEIASHLQCVDGVMLGRAAYSNPWLLTALPGASRRRRTRVQVVAAMVEYARREEQNGVRLGAITRHMAGLYSGKPGAGDWRRALARHASAPAGEARVLLDCVPDRLRYAA
ncbi:MAG: tRNA dihydrouridine(20/20a) synthase DusA [Gammaproteobacteria bacterium]|nr:tRNA dihydrouridine(20/20a) synthase DusA [Gammaproteobacteria bacterium]